MALLVVVTAAVLAATAAVGGTLIVRRRRRPRTKAEKLRAAQAAMKDLRSANRRQRKHPYQGRSDDASQSDRYSAAIAENATYSDASDFSGGGGDGGSGGSW
ncbi:hypothetical protein [Dactylosporangium sp. CA-233914]|uniref:hypothetical protein n=1 Tax=Dactylosporangium sp. CA-233914 TaxID=3239934 RepID=UPI003D89B531